MILTSGQMAKIVKMSRFGFQKLARNLQIPYHRNKANWMLFDTDNLQCSDFFESVKMVQTNPQWKVLYSMRDLATLRGQHKDTIKQLLIENDITIYHSGRKCIILLIDFQRLAATVGYKHAPRTDQEATTS